MERKIKAVQYGCGKMSVYLMRYLIEKGVELKAAFDINPDLFGKDINVIIGGEETGIKIYDAKLANEKLKEIQPDVCVVATRSNMSDIEEIYTVCAKNKVNAISTCEEAIYPWNSSSVITKKLDQLAKENGITLTGSGYPDMFWGVLVDTMAGSMHKLVTIKGSSSYNVEDYGIALAEAHGAGLDQESFEKEIGKYNDLSSKEQQELIEEGVFVPSFMWNQNGWLVERLGLTVSSQTQKCIPTTHPEDLESSTLGRVIKAGDATGMRAIVTTKTKEGITLETECVGMVYGPEDFDRNDWSFIGEPEIEVKVDRPMTVELTCANVVNRIPALLNAQAGYVTTASMPNNVYLKESMEHYIK